MNLMQARYVGRDGGLARFQVDEQELRLPLDGAAARLRRGRHA